MPLLQNTNHPIARDRCRYPNYISNCMSRAWLWHTVVVVLPVLICHGTAVCQPSWVRIPRPVVNEPILALCTGKAHQVYASTNYNRLAVSTDDGSSWSTIPFPASWYNLISVACTHRGTLLGTSASVGSADIKRLRRSEDAGITWSVPDSLIYSKNLEVGGWSNCLPIFECRSGTVLCGSVSGGGMGYGALWRSTNDGRTWANVYPFPRGIAVCGISQAKGDNVFAAIKNIGILHSSDEGATWSLATAGADNCVAALDDSIVVSTNDSLILYSTDLGDHWVAGARTVLGEPIVQAVATPDHVVILGTASHGQIRSVDSCRTFETVDDSIVRICFEQGCRMDLAASQTGVVFLGTPIQGVLRSTDNGLHWQRAFAGLPEMSVEWRGALVLDSTLTVYGTSGCYDAREGLWHWVCANDGLDWDGTPAFNAMRGTNVHGGIRVRNGCRVLATGNGVYESRDTTGRWSARSSGLNFRVVNSIAADNRNNVCVGMPYATQIDGHSSHDFGGGTNASSDCGMPWGSLRFDTRPCGVLGDGRSTFVFATVNGQLYGSSTGGASWDTSSSAIAASCFTSLADSFVLVGGTQGVYVSSNGGAMWDHTTKDLAGTGVTCLAANERGMVFAGTNGAGVFVSRDSGRNWFQFGLNSAQHVSVLSVLASQRLLAVTDSGWYVTAIPTRVEEYAREQASGSRPNENTIANFPNPFTNSTSFSFSLAHLKDADWSITDAYGREIAAGSIRQSDSYHPSVLWNATRFPAGTYFFRLRQGGTLKQSRCVLVR